MNDNAPLQTRFKAGEMIMTQGDPGNCAYIIEEGQVSIFVDYPDGTRHAIAERGPGSLIGEMAIVDKQRRTASVQAIEDCTMITINDVDFQNRLKASDPVLKMITQVILMRYRDTLSRANVFGESPDCANPEELELRATGKGKAVENLKTANEFKAAIDNDELRLFYQPIINLQTGKVCGFEALMRWIHPERGFMPPNLFIPIAEDSGLIVEASDWAMVEASNALERMKKKCDDLDQDAFMSINFTAQDMLEPTFLDKLSKTSQETGVKPNHLKLEMTERLLMNNPEKVRGMLDGCRDAGFQVAIDDFGTGYSSLSYLHHFPIDTLKIDRSFIMQMTKDQSACNLVHGIITLAKSLNMDVVAEGIEEEKEANMLRDMECDMVQGYHFAKPMAEDDMYDWLQKGIQA